MKFLLAFFFTIIACTNNAHAQTVDGKWRLTIKPSSIDLQTDDYIIEFDLKQMGDKVVGTRTLYLQYYPPIIMAVEGVMDKSRQVALHPTKMIQYKLPDSILVAKDFTYQLQWDGNKNFSGMYFPKEDTAKMKIPQVVASDSYNPVYKMTSRANFVKVPDTAYNPFKKLFPQQQLQTEIQHVITIPDGDVKIDLYDNGTVDGDIITVWINDKIVSQHKKLSLAPITINIKKEELQDNTLVIMQAENLGDIPPNTALMLITVAGGKRYDLNLSSTLEKQAAVMLKKEPPKTNGKK